MAAIDQLIQFRKFTVLQHPKAIGTDHDLEPLLDKFPHQIHEGKRKGPSIERNAAKLNGVAIGFETDTGREARTKHVLKESGILTDRAKVLAEFIPSVGRQAVELMARSSYRAGSVLNHQMRNNEPSISMPGM